MTDFYADKNVVVLGGAGFVGRHLCRLLEGYNANVYVIDNLSRHEDQGEQFEIGHYHKLDIMRYSKQTGILTKVMQHINPFAVFNLAAACANVEYNQQHHNQMFLDNVRLQAVPVAICEHISTPHYLQVSSACVYGADANAPAMERSLGGEPVEANAGYSWSKRMGERVVEWSNLKHAVIVRPSNIYGPGDWYDERAHVIPKLIKGYSEGTAKLYSGGGAIREFIYVEDAVRGMLHALEFGKHKTAYNLGTGGKTAVSLLTLHKMIARLLERPLPESVSEPEFDPGDNSRFSYRSGLEKLGKLGWKWETSMMDGLKRTIEAFNEG
ncbi:MAG: NAD-dependent epimerase/dehydratase family protein [Planctomycetaceae bacterium]|nr:NAD-dependent epimerase/dehydratase family protein [Planctomycetaceae bacterium]